MAETISPVRRLGFCHALTCVPDLRHRSRGGAWGAWIARRKVAVPLSRTWHWAFSLFRGADGATVAVIPLMVAVSYGQSIAWVAGVFALMNVAAVPAGLAWARIMSQGRMRRRIAMGGFAGASLALAGMALAPPFPLFVALAMIFAVAGLATAPAAGVLAIEGVPNGRWGEATGALSRHTGISYLLGTALAIALGLTGWLPVQPWIFWIAAASSAAAAVVAARTIPHFDPRLAPTGEYQKDAVQRGQRRFERYFWFPSRLRSLPSMRSLRDRAMAPAVKVLLGIYLVFAGTLVVLASYPGVLVERLQLSPGLVILGQAPSFLASSITYASAGRLGDRLGLVQATRIGLLLRLLVLPALMLTILLAGARGFVLILVLHALLGVTFAFLSVNGPCLAADLYPSRRADAVGWFHAAIALGVMSGALLASFMVATFSLELSYVLAMALLVAGSVLMLSIRPNATGNPFIHALRRAGGRPLRASRSRKQ